MTYTELVEEINTTVPTQSEQFPEERSTTFGASANSDRIRTIKYVQLKEVLVVGDLPGGATGRTVICEENCRSMMGLVIGRGSRDMLVAEYEYVPRSASV